MEQTGISIITAPGITDNSVGKPKTIGITLKPSSSSPSAMEKFKTPWIRGLMKEDATVWDTMLYGLAEVIGTGILVFIGCMGCIGTMGVSPPIIQICLAFGFAVMIAIQCVGHISGAHINPSITLASLILGQKSLPMTIFYIMAQCVGATFGYGLLKALTPQGFLRAGLETSSSSFCMTDMHVSLTLFQGLLAEIIATGILVFFACGVWDARNSRNTDSVPIRFGLCVAVLCFTFVPFTGCSMNPARTFGPAVWNGYWTNHWVFWIGPLGGSMFSSMLYRTCFLPKGKSSEMALPTMET